jgi:hypothetical protein
VSASQTNMAPATKANGPDGLQAMANRSKSAIRPNVWRVRKQTPQSRANRPTMAAMTVNAFRLASRRQASRIYPAIFIVGSFQ